MLAVLAAHSPAAISRDRIAAMLWGDLAEERDRHSLRQVLTALRRDAPIDEASGDTLCLDSRVCTADAAEFAALAASTAPGELERALALHAGAFLDGLATKEEAFEEWLGAERTRLAKAAVETMMRLATHHAGQGEHEAAVRLLCRLLAADPINEDAHGALMRSLEGLGRRSEALQQYQLCKELLLKQLQVEPDAATRALLDSIRKASATLGGAEARGQPVVAVLPFANVARAPELDALAASIADEISRQFSRAPGFRVVVLPAVVAAMRPNPDDLTQLARVLGASYLVTGSLRQPEAGCLRIGLQIVDGEKAQYLWSLQQDLASRGGKAEVDDFVAGTAANSSSASPRPPRAPVATTGRMPGRRRTRPPVPCSRRDGPKPRRTPPYACIGKRSRSIPNWRWHERTRPWSWLSRRTGGLLHGDPARDEARADAEKALELEPTRSEVLGMAACAIAHLGDPARAVPLLERAIEENPNNAQAWAALGATRLLQMQFDAAVEALRRGLRTSPTDYHRSVWPTALASGLLRLNRLNEALDAAHGACRSDARFYPARIVLAMVLTKLGKDRDAVVNTD